MPSLLKYEQSKVIHKKIILQRHFNATCPKIIKNNNHKTPITSFKSISLKIEFVITE